MGLFDWMNAPADPATYRPPAGIPAPDVDRELVLYKYDSCPFCQIVLVAINRSGLDVEMQDTMRDRSARATLFEKTRRTTVPCLFVDGVPFFESSDIVRWLDVYAQRQTG